MQSWKNTSNTPKMVQQCNCICVCLEYWVFIPVISGNICFLKCMQVINANHVHNIYQSCASTELRQNKMKYLTKTYHWLTPQRPRDKEFIYPF